MKLKIVYADNQTRDNQRIVVVNLPEEITSKQLTFPQMDLCEKLTKQNQRCGEVSMSWQVLRDDESPELKQYSLVFFTCWGKVQKYYSTLDELKSAFIDECIETCRYTDGESFIIGNQTMTAYSNEWKELWGSEENVPYRH